MHRIRSLPYCGGSHEALPLPDRNLLVVAEEAMLDNCADGIKLIWLIDIPGSLNPVSVSTVPIPNEEDYCAKGAYFCPRSIHGKRPDGLVSDQLNFASQKDAGQAGGKIHLTLSADRTGVHATGLGAVIQRCRDHPVQFAVQRPQPPSADGSSHVTSRIRIGVKVACDPDCPEKTAPASCCKPMGAASKTTVRPGDHGPGTRFLSFTYPKFHVTAS